MLLLRHNTTVVDYVSSPAYGLRNEGINDLSFTEKKGKGMWFYVLFLVQCYLKDVSAVRRIIFGRGL